MSRANRRPAAAGSTSQKVKSPRPPRPQGQARPPANASWTAISRSPEDTRRLGHRIGKRLRGGEVLALRGDLGAGKTVFVRGVAEGLGAIRGSVSSPTFVFIHEYRGRLPLAHIDLYRTESGLDLDHLGWADYLDGRWVVAVEWAEKAGPALPADRVEITLVHRTPTTRRITCRATGADARRVLAQVHEVRRPRTRPRS